MAQGASRGFPWLFWTLVGCAGWIVLMLAFGTPVGILATPAAGPLSGWLVGGAIYLVTGVATQR